MKVRRHRRKSKITGRRQCSAWYKVGYALGEALNEAIAAEVDKTAKQYEGTELEGLDAYERQLKRFGIKHK